MSEAGIEPNETSESQTRSSRLGVFFAGAFLLCLVALGALVLYRIYPPHIHEKRNPGFIDNIFDTNLVIFAARLVLLSAALVLAFAGAYTVVSVISWIKHRQWLSKAGPFEVSREAIEQLQGLVQFWQEQAVNQANEVQQLQTQLQQTNELLGDLMQHPKSGGLSEEDEAANLGEDDDPGAA